jgi:transposase
MWGPYLDVIKRRAGQAIHVLDRFHIAANLNKAVNEVRAGEARKMASDGFDPLLKHSRWCLLKRPENLTDKQNLKLAELLQYNLKSIRAYLLKEELQLMWDYVSPVWAGKFLDAWCTKVMRSKLEPLKRQARTLRRHRGLILNWFRARGEMSSGPVEGMNNKLKVITRKAYGFKTFKAAEVALYHGLGKLPVPEFAHRFF